ncbi:MAG: efflux RND transporter periplasmic adaptor subunit [Phycisphaerae bacterium]
MILLILWLAGWFHPKLDRQNSGPPPSARRADMGALVEVRAVRMPVTETAVGSVRTAHEVSLAAKILARVVEVNAQAGQPVKAGEVLVRLDDADLRARLEQSTAMVASASAAADQAQIEFDRVRKLLEANTASSLEFERVRTALESARAELQRVRQARQEAEVTLDYATVRSPIDGVVVDKRIEVGDTATPGRLLATLMDPTRMQLVANVRESLTQRLKTGQDISVHINALDMTCVGQISEIVPEAEQTSRSFLVKVTGPCPPGVYPGMFGRLLIPMDDEEVLIVPAAAIRRVGQLDMVDVSIDGALIRRVVQLGRRLDEGFEVLSGLRAGERVALQAQDDKS